MTAFGGNVLQEQMFAALIASSDLVNRVRGVYDQPPASAEFPFITFGDTNVQSNDMKDRNGNRVSASVIVWSNEHSQMETKEIMAAVDGVLNRFKSNEHPQYDTLELRLENASVRRQFDESGPIHVGRLVYAASMYAKG